MINYDDFLARLENISIGAEKSYVETILGEPQSISDKIWNYDLRGRRGFPGIPPSPGNTVFVSISIVFQEDQVEDISRNWIDAIGPKN